MKMWGVRWRLYFVDGASTTETVRVQSGDEEGVGVEPVYEDRADAEALAALLVKGVVEPYSAPSDPDSVAIEVCQINW